MSEIILDTETTGLSPLEGDRIIEIACIETKGLIPTKKRFHILLNPEKKISEDAFKVHGYSNEFLKDKKKFKEIADEFLNFIKEKDLIIHNAPFDLGFLNHELRLANRSEIKKNKVISFKEKPQVTQGWINGGFFIAKYDFFDLIKNDLTILEKRPLEKASSTGQLQAFQYRGFWKCMDTKRDLEILNDLWNTNPPWFS